MSLPSNDEIDAMSVSELKAFLVANNIAFGATALKPELIQTARAFVMEGGEREEQPLEEQTANGSTSGTVTIEPVEDPEPLRMLQAAGFKNREEVLAYIDVLRREKEDVARRKEELAITEQDMEQKDIAMTAREVAVVAQAQSVADDIIKQQALYDKLAAMKEQHGLSEQNT